VKLRNKRTRGLANCEPIEVKTDAGFHDYYSLAELNEEWEDYKPEEPLIEDEEIREIIRAWADVNDAGKLKYNSDENSLDDIYRNTITFNRGLSLKDGHSYTIPELCGEEEE
jgi:hypothetical protein